MTRPNSSTVRFAAIDLGSLTVRLAVAEPGGPQGFRILAHYREITGLGQGLAQTGELAPEGMDRTLRALQLFCRIIADYQVEKVRIVATQAVRVAGNGPAFLAQLRISLGLTVEVLSPEEEARLSFRGVLSALDHKYLQTPILVFDVCGGSSEFALVRPGQEPRFASLPLGVLTLSQAHPLGDPPEPKKVAVLCQELSQRLGRLRDRTFPPALMGSARLVGTAGAVTTLAALHLKLEKYEANRVNNLVLTRAQVEELTRLISRLPEVERALLPGLEPAKAKIMVAGALIILTILEVFSRDSLVVIDAGLLEGVLLSFGFRVSSFELK